MEIVEGHNQPIITPFEEIVEEKEEDRISALPDGLLLDILSRLPNTESAVRTGILSKRWKYLWTWVPTLIFYCRNQLSDFISFVDKTLTQCRQSKLKKFVLHTRYTYQSESHVDNWVRYAISCNVEELDLNFGYGAPYELDEYFFNNPYFTHLTLHGCIFDPIGVISWKRLKIFRIYEGDFGADVIENIISGSPLLEKLVLDEYYGYSVLDITSQRIKKLMSDLNCEFEMEVNDSMLYVISCNIEKLDLNFCNEDYVPEFTINEDFFINSRLTRLKLTCCIFNPKGVIHWKRLKTLYIDNGNLDENVIGNILSGSPLLQTLVLMDCYGYRRLDITSTRVKKLVFSRYWDHLGEVELPDVIEINVPNILSLTIQGYLHLVKLRLSNVSSLVKANLDITDELHEEPTLAEEQMLKGYILSLLPVKELNIGASCFKDAYKQAMLEKYKESMLEKYKEAVIEKDKLVREFECMVASFVSEEVQLKEELQKLEHEMAERETDQEQLKLENNHKIEHEQVE